MLLHVGAAAGLSALHETEGVVAEHPDFGAAIVPFHDVAGETREAGFRETGIGIAVKPARVGGAIRGRARMPDRPGLCRFRVPAD